MHIFLTGEVRAGKSTIIDSFLTEHPELIPGGFRTVRGEGEDDSVYIVPVSGVAECNGKNRVGIRKNGTHPVSFPEVFDSVGVRLLNCPSCDIIIMDELGIMENGASAFIAAVLKLLDSDTPILGVIKPKHTAFLGTVRAHPKLKLLKVTPEKRNMLSKSLQLGR